MKSIKRCENKECREVIINFKSAKRKYCDDYCKNRAGYLRNLKINAVLIEKDKKLKENYKILTNLKSKGIDSIYEQTLISHGFSFNDLHERRFIIFNDELMEANNIYDIDFIIKEKQLIIIN